MLAITESAIPARNGAQYQIIGMPIVWLRSAASLIACPKENHKTPVKNATARNAADDTQRQLQRDWHHVGKDIDRNMLVGQKRVRNRKHRAGQNAELHDIDHARDGMRADAAQKDVGDRQSHTD